MCFSKGLLVDQGDIGLALEKFIVITFFQTPLNKNLKFSTKDILQELYNKFERAEELYYQFSCKY